MHSKTLTARHSDPLLPRILALPSLRHLLPPCLLLALSACATTGPVARTCVSRPTKQGAVCLGPDRSPVCKQVGPDGKCLNYVTPYAETDGMLMLDPEEYKARIKRAQEE